jgi:hypothetical protein
MADDLRTEVVKGALEPVGDLVKRIAGPLAEEIGAYRDGGPVPRPTATVGQNGCSVAR